MNTQVCWIIFGSCYYWFIVHVTSLKYVDTQKVVQTHTKSVRAWASMVVSSPSYNRDFCSLIAHTYLHPTLTTTAGKSLIAKINYPVLLFQDIHKASHLTAFYAQFPSPSHLMAMPGFIIQWVTLHNIQGSLVPRPRKRAWYLLFAHAQTPHFFVGHWKLQ